MDQTQQTRGRVRSTVTIVAVTAVVAATTGLLLGGALGPGSASAAPSSGNRAAKLFVVDGTSGWATQTGDRTWRVELADPTVVWFQDRPYRNSGSQSARSLVGAWPRLFASAAPNGALVAPGGPQGQQPTAAELTDPSYDASTGVASFTLRLDRGDRIANAAWLSRLTRADAGRNGRVVLFVDAGTSTAAGTGNGTCQVFAPGQGEQSIYCSQNSYAQNSQLGGVDLQSSSFDHALFPGSSFSGASFYYTDLSGACMQGANLPDGSTFASAANC